MKLYRVYKHYEREFNFLFIEIILHVNNSLMNSEQIFKIKWQQTDGENQYYAKNYVFESSIKKKIKLFYDIVSKIETSSTDYDIQPYEFIQLLEKLNYKQCEYYDLIGFCECDKVENKNNNVYTMFVDHHPWASKLAYKRSYKKQLLKNSNFSIRNGLKKVDFKISDKNDKIKNIKRFNIKSLYREFVMYKGSEEEKKRLIREEKLERILNEK